MDTDDCDGDNGNCTNTVGSYNCSCNTGYTGDGLNCTGQFNTKSLLMRILVKQNVFTESCSVDSFLSYAYSLMYSIQARALF